MLPAGEKNATFHSLATLTKVIHLVEEKYNYEDPTVKEFWERICNENLQHLITSKCFYHGHCYSDFDNTTKRDAGMK